jgi:hypothetical protein
MADPYLKVFHAVEHPERFSGKPLNVFHIYMYEKSFRVF